ncbi:hypothetical protein ES703_49772 [subsurface metagenome]
MAEKPKQPEKKKVCPLSFQWIHRNFDDTGFTWQECLEERCAWWNKCESRCAIRALALRG